MDLPLQGMLVHGGPEKLVIIPPIVLGINIAMSAFLTSVSALVPSSG
jgi:hypothetical protein